MATVLTPPSGEPSVQRRFQYTNLKNNSNKYWVAELWPLDGGKVFFRARFGGIGEYETIHDKIVSEREVEAKIREKQRKGYHEVALAQPTTDSAAGGTTLQVPRPLAALWQWLCAEAREGIDSYLDTTIDALSQAQIRRGRALLQEAQNAYRLWQESPTNANAEALVATVEAFFMNIPTRLERPINLEREVRRFCADFGKQEERLNQLEAAVDSFGLARQGDAAAPFHRFAARLEPVPPFDARFDEVARHIRTSSRDPNSTRWQMDELFAVAIPAEREAYRANRYGRSTVRTLFHGTRGEYLYHILMGQGLICPQVPAHGRMMGSGIYLGMQPEKSDSYCWVFTRRAPRFLLLVDASVGTPFLARDAMPALRQAPKGYHSVWGKAGHTLSWGGPGTLIHDEIVVYRPEQLTIRYLATFR